MSRNEDPTKRMCDLTDEELEAEKLYWEKEATAVQSYAVSRLEASDFAAECRREQRTRRGRLSSTTTDETPERAPPRRRVTKFRLDDAPNTGPTR